MSPHITPCPHDTVRVEMLFSNGGWYGHCANCNAELFLEFLILQTRR